MPTLSAINPVFFILLPIILVQYALAFFCIYLMLSLKLSKKATVIWHLVILIVFFIGPITFLIYRQVKKKNIPVTADNTAIVNDPADDNINAPTEQTDDLDSDIRG